MKIVEISTNGNGKASGGKRELGSAGHFLTSLLFNHTHLSKIFMIDKISYGCIDNKCFEGFRYRFI